jgi:hypothetical protein
MDSINEYNRKYGKYLIGLDEYKCNKCKKIWKPTDKDINRKAMHCYYKNCGVCREYLMNRRVQRRNELGLHETARLRGLECCTEDII